MARKQTPEIFENRADKQNESIEERQKLNLEVKAEIAKRTRDRLETLKSELKVVQKPPTSIKEFSHEYLAETGFYNESDDREREMIVKEMGIDSTRNYDPEALREGEDSIQSEEQQVV